MLNSWYSLENQKQSLHEDENQSAALSINVCDKKIEEENRRKFQLIRDGNQEYLFRKFKSDYIYKPPNHIAQNVLYIQKVKCVCIMLNIILAFACLSASAKTKLLVSHIVVRSE